MSGLGSLPRELHFVDLGQQGRSLVMLPGVGGTTRYFRSRITPLAERHRIRLVDLLGFGESLKPWLARYTIARHLAELDRVVAPLAAREPLVLVGHSFGAILALAYAARWPDRVAGLVLISLPHFGSQRRAVRYMRHQGSAEGWLLSNVVLATITCLVTRRVIRRFLPRLRPDLPREIVEDLVKHTWRSSTSTVWEGVYRHDVAHDAARLPGTLPVLLLHGERDLSAPLANVRALVRSHPAWRLTVLPGVDHHPLVRQTSTCLDAIAHLVEAIPGGRPGPDRS